MAKNNLQEFVLSFKLSGSTPSSEILIEIDTMDQIRQVLEMMNNIGKCENYDAWTNGNRGLDKFKENKATFVSVDVLSGSVTYKVNKKVEDFSKGKLAVIHAKDYTTKRERKKLIL